MWSQLSAREVTISHFCLLEFLSSGHFNWALLAQGGVQHNQIFLSFFLKPHSVYSPWILTHADTDCDYNPAQPHYKEEVVRILC